MRNYMILNAGIKKAHDDLFLSLNLLEKEDTVKATKLIPLDKDIKYLDSFFLMDNVLEFCKENNVKFSCLLNNENFYCFMVEIL